MKWVKKGLIFRPDGKSAWQKTHAALPTRLHLGGDLYRIYFTSRDENNRAHVGWFEFDITRPFDIIRVSPEPVLAPGPLGYFDDHGVQACTVIEHNGKHYMYYLGWNPGLTQPLFYTSIGLAISEDGGLTFEKYSPAPILSRSKYDPWMVSGGSVLLEDDRWRLWYLSGFRFDFDEEGKAISFYDIKYAESSDGIHWERNGVVSLPLGEEETNISRPTIIRESGKYYCWYPTKKRGMGYRVGYAESDDAITWLRKDEEVGIDVTPGDWDSDSLDKMEVILHKGTRYMLYNGNRFGYDGIGLAVYE